MIKILDSIFIAILLVCSAFSSEKDSIPIIYPLFNLYYSMDTNGEFSSCRKIDFENSCHNSDNECKTLKGLCGESLSSYFFETTSLKKLEGKYDDIHGFDGFYKISENESVYVIVEDKFGLSACLNAKSNQMSLTWQEEKINFLKEKGKITDCEHKIFLNSLSEGKVVSLFTRTIYKDNKFCTEISLCGSPKWKKDFITNYIINYKKYIHDIIFNDFSKNTCVEKGIKNLYCIDINNDNYKILKNVFFPNGGFPPIVELTNYFDLLKRKNS